MSSFARRRGAAVTALALAGGALLASVATAGTAGASTLSGPAFFSAATEGDVVQVDLNLPAALPNLPQNIVLALVSAKGNALHDSLTGKPDVSQSFARLAGGNLVEGANAPLSILDKQVSADLKSPSASDSLATIPTNPIANGAVGALKALVTPVTIANDSTANLAKIDVLKLSDILGALGNVGDQINQALNDAVSNVTPATQNVINTAVDNLNSVLNQIQQNDPSGQSSQITSQITTLTDALKSLQSKLPAMLDAALSSPVISLDTLDANQDIARTDKVTAQAHAGLVRLNILGGLVDVKGFVSDAVASANGKAGGATASYNPVIAQASIGNGLLGIKLDAAGLGLTSSDLGQYTDQVNQILATVQNALNSALNAIGVKITPVPGSSSVSPDGKSAKAVGGAMLISLTPPAGTPGVDTNTPLLAMKIGGTVAQVNAAPDAGHGEIVTARPPALPHTGANLPLAGGVGIALFATAAVLRRRLGRDAD